MHEIKDGKVTMSTGVTFEIKNVPVFAFDEIKKQMRTERPKVPVVWLKDKDREESNPNDPDYIAAVKEYESILTEKLFDMAIVLGTTPVVGQRLNGIPKVEDESWAEPLKKLGIEIPDEEQGRYLKWVKLCAAPTDEDLASLLLACSRSAGVTEEDVAESSASFRGTEARGADRDSGN